MNDPTRQDAPARPDNGQGRGEERTLPPALELKGISRIYRQGERELAIFRDLDFTLPVGQITALVGPSGAGKSSLLHIAGLLEKPTSGEVWIAGHNCTALDDAARTRLRRIGIGFVYQFHHLLPEFTAEENVMLPQLIAGRSREEARTRARELLAQMGLAERLNHRPAELSGGEQQRVAIARALANRPLLLLADEPTGNLDPETAERVHAGFLELIRTEGLAALIATHNLDLARSMHRIVHLDKGRLVDHADWQTRHGEM
ncbi:ABC transporter ATP-binding protein [Thermopetrobacter sp. TC1]|uniref:ABC transporter ATP-binding protein n=1 Tax=Thermopetrobacter sp. TC1 TaxID=1495045 RepID=UPI0009DCB6FB|nr:ABC transporter ATP-binding protein [Thermopetrobacter sp. TC1]